MISSEGLAVPRSTEEMYAALIPVFSNKTP